MTSCNFLDKLRKPKVAGMSIFDHVATLVVAIIIGVLVNHYNPFASSVVLNIFIIFILLIVLGIIIHKLFRVPTMLNYYLGLNSREAVMASRKKC